MILRDDTSKATLLLIAAALIWMWAASAACTGEERSANGSAIEQVTVFDTEADYHVHTRGGAEEREAELIADIRAARQSIEIAVSTLADEEVAQALIAARENGVDVRVVSDWDERESTGLMLLEENGIIPVYGDGELRYLPEPTLSSILGRCQPNPPQHYVQCSRGQGSVQGTMLRPGDYSLMSHNFAIIDAYTVWNFPAFDSTSRDWIGWRIESSLLAYDFLAEFKQMHSGTFATTLDKYNGPVKSSTDYNVRYLTDEGSMNVWFNPQERLMKTVIDHVYRAKASVWISTDNLTNPFLLDALKYKADNGFDVRIIVHPDHQAEGEPEDRLEELGVQYAPEGYEHLSTLLVIDSELDRNDVKRARKVLSLSHPLLRGGPWETKKGSPTDVVYIYPADLFADGNLWMLEEGASRVHKMALIDQYERHLIDLWETSK